MKRNRFTLAVILALTIVVIVIGCFVYKHFLTKSQTSNISSDSQLLTMGSTADWKIYSNTEYGFSVKYPESIKSYPMGEAGTASTQITLPNIPTNDVSEKTLMISYYASKSTPENEVNTRIEQNKLDKYSPFPEIVGEDYSIGEIRGKKLVAKSDDIFRYDIFVLHNKVMYQFHILAKPVNDKITMKLVDQILATFKYIN